MAPTPRWPFNESVTGAIAGEQQAALCSALTGQRDLIRSALSSGGPRAVVVELARVLDCWVLVLDEAGAPRHGWPDEARRHAARIRLDLDRLGLDQPGHAAAVDMAGEQVAILPIGADGHVGGFLAVGRGVPLCPAEHPVLASAVGLLALDMAGERQAREAQRRARLAVFRLAAAGHVELAESAADTLEVALPDAPLRVGVLGCAPEDVPALLSAAERHAALSQAGALVARQDRHSVAVLLPVAEGDLQALEEVLHRVPGSRGAVSDGVPFSGLPEALRRARSVFFGTTNEAGRLALAKDVATAGLLAQLDTPGVRGWAEALLEPLDRHASRSKLDLISTLRVFLANNGHVDASANALGIHRHTLRYRLGRITNLLGSELDDPTVRAELWLALRLRESW